MSVFRRTLAAGSEYDVRFNDLKEEDALGVAEFVHAQGRRTYTPGVLRFKRE